MREPGANPLRRPTIHRDRQLALVGDAVELVRHPDDHGRGLLAATRPLFPRAHLRLHAPPALSQSGGAVPLRLDRLIGTRRLHAHRVIAIATMTTNRPTRATTTSGGTVSLWLIGSIFAVVIERTANRW